MKKVELVKFCKSFFFLCEEQGYHFYINDGRAVFVSDTFRVEYFEELYSESGYINLINHQNQCFSLIELCYIVGGVEIDGDIEDIASSFHVNYQKVLSVFDYVYESYHKKFDDYFPDSEEQLIKLEKQWQLDVRRNLNV